MHSCFSGSGIHADTMMINQNLNSLFPVPTAFFCFPTAWQISLAAVICAFSPSRAPTVARRINEIQRRQQIASIWVCVALGWETSSRMCSSKVEKFLSSHWPPSVEMNTTQDYKELKYSQTLKAIKYATCL